jgi:hypothetical protein
VLDYHSVGGITSWLPLFLFVILFGLSMDYHVLILSRVREAYDAGLTTEQAVAHGIRTTASVVTSAAIVMVGVFAIFATLGLVDMKMMGIGLAVAVLLDATIVRAVLLPSAMTLLGDWNWYLPRWLECLARHAREAGRATGHHSDFLGAGPRADAGAAGTDSRLTAAKAFRTATETCRLPRSGSPRTVETDRSVCSWRQHGESRTRTRPGRPWRARRRSTHRSVPRAEDAAPARLLAALC